MKKKKMTRKQWELEDAMDTNQKLKNILEDVLVILAKCNIY